MMVTFFIIIFLWKLNFSNIWLQIIYFHKGKVYLIEFKRIFKFIHDKMIDDFLTHQFKEFDKDSTGSLGI